MLPSLDVAAEGCPTPRGIIAPWGVAKRRLRPTGKRRSVSLITSGFSFLYSDAPTADGHSYGDGDAVSICYCIWPVSPELRSSGPPSFYLTWSAVTLRPFPVALLQTNDETKNTRVHLVDTSALFPFPSLHICRSGFPSSSSCLISVHNPAGRAFPSNPLVHTIKPIADL